jgi:hypothetical protein
MWDGRIYDTHEAAEAKRKEYEAQKFETQLVKQGDKVLLYTRREITEIVVEGEPPVA